MLAPIVAHPNDVKERLSLAYVTAVAARAGCHVTEYATDKQSVDATIRPIQGAKLAIDLQIKATSLGTFRDEVLVFDLPVKNYDDLRDPTGLVPHYLIVVVLAPDEQSWLESDEQALSLRHCGYWLDLRGGPPTSNRVTVTVALPRSQRFDVGALQSMMLTAYQGRASRQGTMP